MAGRGGAAKGTAAGVLGGHPVEVGGPAVGVVARTRAEDEMLSVRRRAVLFAIDLGLIGILAVGVYLAAQVVR